jgi:hypothetical protein
MAITVSPVAEPTAPWLAWRLSGKVQLEAELIWVKRWNSLWTALGFEPAFRSEPSNNMIFVSEVKVQKFLEFTKANKIVHLWYACFVGGSLHVCTHINIK